MTYLPGEGRILIVNLFFIIYFMKEKTFKFEGQEYTADQLSDLCGENGYSFYIEGNEDAEELDTVTTLNPENRQKEITLLTDKDDVDYENSKTELALGDKYTDYYNNTATRIMNLLIEEDSKFNAGETDEQYKLDKIDIGDYNEYVDAFNQYGDMEKLEVGMTAEKGLEILNNNDNQIH